jgi:hypothetical protein
MQRAAQEQVDAVIDGIVSEALERHDAITTVIAPHSARTTPTASTDTSEAPASRAALEEATVPGAGSSIERRGGGARMAARRTAGAGDDEHAPRRERDIAAFRERRRQVADEARAEARQRITRTGELACVADALAALAHQGARPWDEARQELERAFDAGRIVDVGAVARRAVWAISRDAARSSRRARRDPDLALAACVAYAIIARLPRCALRSAQRTRPAPHHRQIGTRPFWR